MSGRGEGFGWALLLELVPAALFGCAVAFAAGAALAASLQCALSVIGGLIGGCGAWLLLRGFRGAPQYRMPQFARLALDLDAPDDPPAEHAELLLDDVLAPVEPGSRVISLFDRQPVRSSNGLHSPVPSHLRSAVRPIPTPPDATEALHEALASLRQSLR